MDQHAPELHTVIVYPYGAALAETIVANARRSPTSFGGPTLAGDAWTRCFISLAQVKHGRTGESLPSPTRHCCYGRAASPGSQRARRYSQRGFTGVGRVTARAVGRVRQMSQPRPRRQIRNARKHHVHLAGALLLGRCAAHRLDGPNDDAILATPVAPGAWAGMTATNESPRVGCRARVGRNGRRLGRPGWWFLLLAALIALPGVVLIVFTHGWAQAIGIVLVLLAGPPAVIASAPLIASLVARWAGPPPVVCLTVASQTAKHLLVALRVAWATVH